jgi:PAS domain S-box-containing protein
VKQAQYELILENLPFGAVFVQEDRVAYINTAGENIIGISRQKMQKLSFFSLPFSEKVLGVFKRVLADGKLAKIYEEPYINYFGNKYLLNFFFIAIPGRKNSYIVVMEDCSFVKAMEATKYDHAHIEKLAVLFASMAHEIKNPLSVIKGTAQLMKKDNPVCDNEAYGIIFSEIERIEKLIQDLIDYSGPKKVNVAMVDILGILKKVTAALYPLIKEKNLLILKEYDSTIPHMLGDGESLYKAFFNLIKNAAEACGFGGRVTIGIKILMDMKHRENNREYNYALFEVADTGEGIKKENIDKLFTPFYTTKANGTGLGMVYTQKVILDHGGFLKVDSIPKQGTKISIYLPMKEYL